MKTAWMALPFVCAASLAFAQVVSYPDSYWDHQYGYSQQWSVMYNVLMKVASTEEANEKAVKILEKAGARPAPGAYYGHPRPGQAVQFSYLIPVETAEKTAKRLIDLGDLQQFSSQKVGSTSQLPEIREKLAALQAEMKENAKALERLPIARAMMTSALNRLTLARDSAEASAGTAIISLTLVDATALESPRGGGLRPGAPDEEGAAKGALGAVRSAISIYYGDAEGRYPSKLSDLTAGGKYLTQLPKIQVGPHKATDSVVVVTGVSDLAALKSKLKDTGGWAYVSDPQSPIDGAVVIDCTHKDSRGKAWVDY